MRKHMQKTTIIMHEIKKLIKPLIAEDRGRISLGKYTFFIIPAFFLTLITHSLITV